MCTTAHVQTNPVLQSVSFERKYGGSWPQTTIQPPESQQAGQSAQRRIETNHQQTIRQLGVLIGIKSKQLKNQVDLEDFYKDGPDETENQNPRMFFDEISAFESQVILVLPPGKTFSLILLGNIKTDKFSSWGINNLYWIWCLSLQIAQPPDSNYIATHQSTDIGKLCFARNREFIFLYFRRLWEAQGARGPSGDGISEIWSYFMRSVRCLCCRCPTSWRWSLWGNT